MQDVIVAKILEKNNIMLKNIERRRKDIENIKTMDLYSLYEHLESMQSLKNNINNSIYSYDEIYEYKNEILKNIFKGFPKDIDVSLVMEKENDKILKKIKIRYVGEKPWYYKPGINKSTKEMKKLSLAVIEFNKNKTIKNYAKLVEANTPDIYKKKNEPFVYRLGRWFRTRKLCSERVLKRAMIKIDEISKEEEKIEKKWEELRMYNLKIDKINKKLKEVANKKEIKEFQKRGYILDIEYLQKIQNVE